MECPLEKEDKAVEQNKYIRSFEETIIKFYEDSITKQAAYNEWIRKFIENTESNIRELKTKTKNLQEKACQLTQTVLTNIGEKVKERTTMGKENVKEPVPRDLPVVQTYVPPTQFLGNPYRTHETICAIGIPKEIKEDEGDMNCNTPKIGSQRNVFPGALLHDPIAQVRKERPLTESFEKKSCKFGLQCTSSMSYIYFT
ncbi:hypothetical protein Tco_1146351 [Tanacetum coccineum]